MGNEAMKTNGGYSTIVTAMSIAIIVAVFALVAIESGVIAWCC